jgi:formylglycine-generating enzyme required for sulfatase activity
MKRGRKLSLAAAMIVVPIGVSAFSYGIGRAPVSATVALPQMVELPPGVFDYRASGTFTRDGRAEGAPKTAVAVPRTLAIMTHQVTAADYRRCVEAKACALVDRHATSPDRPAVKISWRDAHAYADWLSRETGVHFRLPTDEEWAYAAAERFADDALKQTADNRDVGKREVAAYEREADSAAGLDQPPQPVGSFGANQKGLVDLAGNVWEWTDTCFTRNVFDAGDTVAPVMTSCGIRIAEGRHRAYILDFIHDARGGGCAVGTPPTNLGFRLVRDDRSERSWYELQSLLTEAQRFVGLRS